ncbi:hypothetical protein BBH88_05255 [Planococcus antarcticus DSM 14505]|uniref:Catalase immune-responsive domain-containing protein n=1 Tax=Planococcus antarcticus DSM 14505 TaxID=1185653 RepID=A0ABN4RH51_9BACL|nr:hypothetical protein BBH88_05255 [Planococcus antarcticus DSM 14505]
MGQIYQSFEDWERDELINNLGDALSICVSRIQEEVVHNFARPDEDYGRRIRENVAQKIKAMKENERLMYGVFGKRRSTKWGGGIGKKAR